MKITLSKIATAAAWHCLSNTDAKARSELRNHSRVTRAIRAGATTPDQENQNSFTFLGGEVELVDENLYKYFLEIVDKKVNTGVPGAFAEGYCDLVDALDDAKPKKEG